MYEDAAAERYRNEALRADFLGGNEETTESVGDVEDYEAEEREEIEIFGELDKSEVRFALDFTSQIASFSHKITDFIKSMIPPPKSNAGLNV